MRNIFNKLSGFSHLLFMFGLITSIVVGSLNHDSMEGHALAVDNYFTLLPVMLGVVVGVLNITKREVKTYLIACSAFILSIDNLKFADVLDHATGSFVDVVLDSSLLFVIPITLIVAVKTIITSAET